MSPFSRNVVVSDRASVAEMTLFSLPETTVVVILRLTTKPETELTRPGGGFVSRLRFPGFNGHFGRKRRGRRANRSVFLTNAAPRRCRCVRGFLRRWRWNSVSINNSSGGCCLRYMYAWPKSAEGSIYSRWERAANNNNGASIHRSERKTIFYFYFFFFFLNTNSRRSKRFSRTSFDCLDDSVYDKRRAKWIHRFQLWRQETVLNGGSLKFSSCSDCRVSWI